MEPFYGTLNRSITNAIGCPIPNATNFNIETNFSNANMLMNLSSFAIGLSNYGVIQFSNVNLINISGNNYSSLDFNDNIQISQYSIALNSSILPNLNVSADLIFYNISFIEPEIFQDGVPCSSCNLLVYSNNSVEFSVPHFTNYTVVEGYVPSQNGTFLGNGESGSTSGSSSGSSGNSGINIGSSTGTNSNNQSSTNGGSISQKLSSGNNQQTNNSILTNNIINNSSNSKIVYYIIAIVVIVVMIIISLVIINDKKREKESLELRNAIEDNRTE